MKLSAERLESRDVPATYRLGFSAPPTTDTAAQISGLVHLNAAYPSIPDDQVVVDAATPVEAVRKGFFGRVGVRFVTFNGFYDYGMDTTSENAVDKKPFLLELLGDENGGLVQIRLEDLAGANASHAEQPDWDYDDQVWHVAVFNANAQDDNVPVINPKLEVLDPNDVGLTDLKVGKWENAFEANGANVVTLKPNFIDLDPDRYRLRVTDPKGKDAADVAYNENNTVDTVRVSVSWVHDEGNEVTLTETGANSGVFVSKNLLLVSNQVDDEYKVDGVDDNSLDDRTLHVKLRARAYFTSRFKQMKAQAKWTNPS